MSAPLADRVQPAGLAPAAEALARQHALSDASPRPLASLERLAELSGWLTEIQLRLYELPSATKAAEWLLDNAYLVERAVRQIRQDLPHGYFRRLPALEIDDDSRPPRVYDLARALVRATSLQLTDASITRFVSAYQGVETLQLSELWALPIMLRLTCLEVLATALEQLAPGRPAPFRLGEASRGPREDGGTGADTVSGLHLDETECVARSIRALATLDVVSWTRFVERTSAIEAVLREDPTAAYSRMDGETRDRYRRAVEELACRSHHTEVEVARRALAHARRGLAGSRSSHVGFWLVGEGRTRFERSLRFRIPVAERGRRALRRHATTVYLGGLLLFTAGFLLVPAAYLAHLGRMGASPALAAGALLLLLLPASMLAVTLLHWVLTRILPPTVLPKLDFSRGIPLEQKTAVVIPCLLASSEEVEELLRQLERHALANPGPGLVFALLTDFPDASEARLPGDEALLEQARAGVRELNRRHAPGAPGPFHLLHRERRYNPVEGLWMGWERKRGKLDEFNRLLLGDEETSFEVHEGDATALHGVRYVITLDADTILPQGAAARLVGTLAHPLNRAQIDAQTGRIRAGYTIVQPRIETSPESGHRSLFARLYCGDTAIDIYSRAVSDVYQDLFGTGIYVGKAIYDVLAFSRTLAGRVPENALASHDLFEGIHGRAALASDIVLYEDYPSSYLVFALRLHRWVRGDWQLLPWLRRRVPGARADYLPNEFATIDRWKVLDNLRRSLLPPALLLLLGAGWSWLPGHPLVWTLFAILAPAGHLFVDVATGLVRERWRPSPELSRTVVSDLGRWLLLLVFLPHQAAVTVDAIGRTLVRVAFTRRHLLEWTTAAHTAASVARRRSFWATWREMALAPLGSLMAAAVLLRWHPVALPVAAPFLLLWALSPEIARRISRPIHRRREQLPAEDVAFLRAVARRTWLFFESFVGPDGHWLPPDNYQQDPGHNVAHRTSPTNIGMLLLSSLAAHDLGYLGLEQLGLRLRNTLRTVAGLEHYRGHLLNWTHTRTLQPLSPRYVSTVDSGNLAAALLALTVACEELRRRPVLGRQRWSGLADATALLRESLAGLGGASGIPSLGGLEERAEELDALARTAGVGSEAWLRGLPRIEEKSAELERILLERVANLRQSLDLEVLREVRLWLARVQEQIRAMRHELTSLAPWLAVLDALPELPDAHPAAEELETLRARVAGLLAPTTPLERLSAHGEEVTTRVAEARERLRPGLGDEEVSRPVAQWLDALEKAVSSGAGSLKRLEEDLADLARMAEREMLGMDFGLLYDAQVRHLFIGYNLSADQMDPHHYDLLASEARLASLVAIAKGDVPVEHWFALDRPLTHAGGGLALLSWGGTMFEYLMPPLLVHSHDGTLLSESERAAVLEQIAEGERRGLPWGVSESGFAAFDADHNYQYRAFGVQRLGRKRGLDSDRVVAPYATALALPLFPVASVSNLKRLREIGMLGRYGFFEAVDFTPGRLPAGRDHAIVFSYMSHHQGMVLAALDNLLCDDALVRRFEADARVQATKLLLQERVPARAPLEEPPITPARSERSRAEASVAFAPWRPERQGAAPSVHLLGNGRLTCRVSDAGGGALGWREHALTRCAPDPTLDDAGLWIYVRDEEAGLLWSVGSQPIGVAGAQVDVVFHAHMVELHRRQHGISIRTDIAIGSADDVEVRRITIVNESARPRRISLTSYGEVVLAPASDDLRHPAFSKLFVESRYLPELGGVIFERRRRSPDEHFPVLIHRGVADSAAVAFTGFETDREAFLGRGGSLRRPQGLLWGLSGREGITFDPILALRAEVELAPYATEQLAFVTLAGFTRAAVEETAARYDTLASFEWLLADAHAEAGREAARLGLEADRLPLLQGLLSTLLAANGRLRGQAAPDPMQRASQQDLWALGISGDHPLLLLESDAGGEEGLLADLVRAHRMWRRRGVRVDLVVLVRGATGYRDEVSDGFRRMLEELGAAAWMGRRAGIHLVRADQVSEEQRQLLRSCAGAVLDAERGGLREQLVFDEPPPPLPFLDATLSPAAVDPSPPLMRPQGLLFDHGLGGFSPDGREYLIQLGPGETTPAPWCNVLANEGFGSLVSESGGGYTWAENSGEFRLTPWSNDPVLDAPGEVIYLRDEETTEVWSATPAPAGWRLANQVRHGAGYTEWRQNGHGLASRLRVFVPLDDPVKVFELHLRNHEPRPRRLTVTCYVRWLLGRLPAEGASHVVTAYDASTRSLQARSAWNADFADRVAFLASDREPHGITTDRSEFLGREGDPELPDALRRVGLGGAVGAGLDPCAALQVHLDLGPGAEICTHFVLGAGKGSEHATELVRRWRDPQHLQLAVQRLADHWDRLLSAVTVRTPEPAMDLWLGRWALYQTLSSRILGRTGFYQSSGAFGFRDQLQDVLALLHVDPASTRAHILECARHQFEEGDVLHWWHPPLGRGVRTRCSDDLLWLPYATACYVEATGDAGVLDEEVPFLQAPPLGPEEHERYDLYRPGEERGSLFEHCRRALERGFTRGSHGLPLIGDGDWNDGMNRVGAKGRGESVWLGWFAGATAMAFATLCERRGRAELARTWRGRVREVFAAVEEQGWDGGWYRRAFDDEGRAWGSAMSEECRIDSIAQSWAVLSGGARRDRALMALRSAEAQLVRDSEGVVPLLWPPFDLTERDPGYIKAYPPGIRENGGQYSHAAAWLGWAFAELDDGDRALRVFRLLNPIERTTRPEAVHRYRLEPYAIAADIASLEPHRGRGGWSLYTGAAGWAWRLGVEAILGLRRVGGQLQIAPRLPRSWPGFEATLRTPEGVLEIEVQNPDRVGSGRVEIHVEGVPVAGDRVPLPAGGEVRRVVARVRAPRTVEGGRG